MANNENPISAGQVYRIALHGQGYELTGPHYAVIMSDEAYNALSTVVVIPFSSGARAYSWRIPLRFNGTMTRALVDQIRVLDKRWLREPVGQLTDHVLMEIRFALIDFLGLGDLPRFF